MDYDAGKQVKARVQVVLPGCSHGTVIKMSQKSRRLLVSATARDEPPAVDGGPAANRAERGSMLSIDSLCRRFGAKVAVADVSLRIENGTFVGVIGRSGAGKFTLLRMINRLVEPSAGRIRFNDIDVTALHGRQLRRWRARSAMVFQQFNLIGGWMS